MKQCQQKLHIVTEQPAVAAKLIKKLSPKAKITANENSLDVVAEKLESAKVNQALVNGGVDVTSITFAADRMEDYFIQRMGGRA